MATEQKRLTKNELIRSFDKLPNDATVEDFIDHLAFVLGVEQGMADIAAGRPSEGPRKPYVVFEDVLLPYMLIELESGDPDLVLQRIFDFLEGTAGHGDQRVRDVVGATIFEYLSGHRFLARASKYMGPASRRLAGQIAMAWGHDLPASDRTYERIDEDWYTNRFREEVAELSHAGHAMAVDVLNIRKRLFEESGVPADRL